MNPTLQYPPPADGAEAFRSHLQKFLAANKTQVDWAGIRYLQETTQWREIRNGKPETNSITTDRGVCVEVLMNGQMAYVATSDISEEGLKLAFAKARATALALAPYAAFKMSPEFRPSSQGKFLSPRKKKLDQASLGELTDFLLKTNQHLRSSEKIVNAQSLAMIIDIESLYLSTSGAEISQDFLMIGQNYSATAQDKGESHSRSGTGFMNYCFQMGPEAFSEEALFPVCERIGREAVELLTAENCPSDTRDLILHPDQMTLQIHESIGHPLELDRILGDERNFAGWSFVKPTDFGKLQYGSKLMNVSFDPNVRSQYASYAFDDCGNPATREFLIKEGRLVRGLGSLESQKRLNISGVANFRASSWNRAPIDRMANINLESGDMPLKKMIESTEKGIYMQSNRSWSIDDYRNKFQFGCEYAQLIENGRLTKVVRNPNYRGATISFWNSLKGVGPESERIVYGSPYCGKGEPSQIIRVGHASPPALFGNVEVFGGGQ